MIWPFNAWVCWLLGHKFYMLDRECTYVWQCDDPYNGPQVVASPCEVLICSRCRTGRIV